MKFNNRLIVISKRKILKILRSEVSRYEKQLLKDIAYKNVSAKKIYYKIASEFGLPSDWQYVIYEKSFDKAYDDFYPLDYLEAIGNILDDLKNSIYIFESNSLKVIDRYTSQFESRDDFLSSLPDDVLKYDNDDLCIFLLSSNGLLPILGKHECVDAFLDIYDNIRDYEYLHFLMADLVKIYIPSDYEAFINYLNDDDFDINAFLKFRMIFFPEFIQKEYNYECVLKGCDNIVFTIYGAILKNGYKFFRNELVEFIPKIRQEYDVRLSNALSQAHIESMDTDDIDYVNDLNNQLCVLNHPFLIKSFISDEESYVRRYVKK